MQFIFSLQMGRMIPVNNNLGIIEWLGRVNSKYVVGYEQNPHGTVENPNLVLYTQTELVVTQYIYLADDLPAKKYPIKMQISKKNM